MKISPQLSFKDLYDLNKLNELDDLFLVYLKDHDHELHSNLVLKRKNFICWDKSCSDLIIKLAPILEHFIASIFNINDELNVAQQEYPNFAKIYECKRNFIQRVALKGDKVINHSFKELISKLESLISKHINKYDNEAFEQIFAEYTLIWMKDNEAEKLKIAKEYALWACLTEEGKEKHKKGMLFKFPEKIELENLVELKSKLEKEAKIFFKDENKCHAREGFKLTDKGESSSFAYDQSKYCIHCHNQEKDSCSKGLNEQQSGCPLDEKISEMNLLKSESSIIGALAVAVIDNPMLAATGHRICNECMKACIYQKQKPVDIPQIETRILKDVLNLPWGFEIYSLLTRWNPLNFKQHLPKATNGGKVLVVGMGPAGFTLAHYLLNQGHIVVGIDGLKIEPLDNILLNTPIKDVNQLFKELDERVVGGFGGVMEYGITNRWNKNFLFLIKVMLERRANFKLFSGVRFGSNITPQQAFDLGFQHIALALGAGRPKLLEVKNGMAKGIKTASDFLMSLQLGEAYKADSLTNLQIRMPVVVIGGGLTALDAATESLAYYPKMLQKFVEKYKQIELSEEEGIIADEFIAHHKLIQNSESQLRAIKSLGGVKILYRNNLQKAPSYRLNHEELNLGLSEGVEFVENFIPKKVKLDKYLAVEAIEGTQIINGEEKNITFPAKTILIAAGTVPNVVLASEFPQFLKLENGYFKIIKDEFITYNEGNNSISFFGDLHPNFAGNVVKAMASAKKGYPAISRLIKEDLANKKSMFFAKLEELLVPKLKEINRLTDNIIELVIKSPLSAQNFKPGQFFRLQNYYSDFMPMIEPIALTGAKVEGDQISTIVLEMGTSSKLCASLKKDNPVVLMGPTGTETEISANEKVMLVGGGLGNAVLFSIGQALKAKNSKVLYFAGYRKLKDRYKFEEIEKAADQIIWSCDEAMLDVTREGDFSYQGNIIESILKFGKNYPEELKSIDRIIVIGSDKMMHALKKARFNILKPFLKENHKVIASINSPMQCMMKEICGQCLQRHYDEKTDKEYYVFSCTNQDQDIDRVDFYHLNSRLSQNSLLEKINII